MLPTVTVTVTDKLINSVFICELRYFRGIYNYFENICLVSY